MVGERTELGDQPIEEEVRQQMNELAAHLEKTFNPDRKRRWGFILLSFMFGQPPKKGGRANYISNAKREDVVSLLMEQVVAFASDKRFSIKKKTPLERLVLAAPLMLEALKGAGCICRPAGIPDEGFREHSPKCKAIRSAIRAAEKGI